MPGPNDSVFDVATIAGLEAATLEARLGAHDGLAAAGGLLDACLLAAEGVVHAEAGRRGEARGVIDRAMQVCEAARCEDVRLLFLGFQFHFRAGCRDEAERLTRRRLELVPAASADAARAWSNLGLIVQLRAGGAGSADAEAMFHRAVEIDRCLGDEVALARDLGNLALVFESRGELVEAERLTREALAIGERLGATMIVASKLCNLGEILMAQGRGAEAVTPLERAEAIYASQGIESLRSVCAGHLRTLGRDGA